MDQRSNGACPWCGGGVRAGAAFCGSCGRPLAPVGPVPYVTPGRQGAGRAGAGRLALVAIAAVAIVATGVGAGLMLRSRDGPNPAAGAPTRDPATSQGTAAGASSGPVATSRVAAGHEDPSDLVPPDPGEGDVPPPEETGAATGTLTRGDTSDLASQAIGPSGGTIEAGGLRLEFPADTFPADTPVKVTQAPVTAAGFGGRFTPLTPLYTVTAGDGTLNALVTVTLPASVPDGATALAFFYDDASGTLTPLAPIDANATSITAAANHFSGIVGGVFTEAATTADSGFRPGIDDWQFANKGSYIVPKGHCEGMSDTAIWYYLFQRRKGGASPLYGLYDNNGAADKTPTLQWDDSDGYRLASNVQADPTADLGRFEASWKRLFQRPDDRMTWAAFRAAIDFTGEPQEITISATPERPQHAMIVYRVTADRLFIADPNYPGKLRTIRYDAATGNLSPYSSGANAAEIAANGPKIYTKFAYVPWRSAATEARIAAHWAEFEKGTAGDAVFPPYALEALAGTDEAGAESWLPLVDGYASTGKQLRIRVRDPADANGVDVAIKVFPGTSTIPLGNFAMEQMISLQDGDTPLGIQVDFSKRADTDWRYVDFVRLTVRQQAATPTPAAGSHWELISSGRGQEFAATGSISDGGLADPDVNGYSGTGAWPTPPSVLTPGQSAAVALSASIGPTCSAAEAEVPGLDGETPVSHKMILSAGWAFPYGPETAIGSVEADCLHAEVSQSFDWVVPEPTGDTTHLGLRIRGGVDMGDRHAYEYVYEWRP